MLPVEAGQLEAGSEQGHRGRPARVAPGLQQQDAHLRVLRQPQARVNIWINSGKMTINWMLGNFQLKTVILKLHNHYNDSSLLDKYSPDLEARTEPAEPPPTMT